MLLKAKSDTRVYFIPLENIEQISRNLNVQEIKEHADEKWIIDLKYSNSANFEDVPKSHSNLPSIQSRLLVNDWAIIQPSQPNVLGMAAKRFDEILPRG